MTTDKETDQKIRQSLQSYKAGLTTEREEIATIRAIAADLCKPSAPSQSDWKLTEREKETVRMAVKRALNLHPDDDASAFFAVNAALQNTPSDALTAADYEEVLADHRRLVRELDVALNGEEGAAQQASLCDIVHMVKDRRLKLISPSDVMLSDERILELANNCAVYIPDAPQYMTAAQRENLIAFAREIQKLSANAGTVPGWKLVPIEPTIEMNCAAVDVYRATHNAQEIYRAMLSAAPTLDKCPSCGVPADNGYECTKCTAPLDTGGRE